MTDQTQNAGAAPDPEIEDFPEDPRFRVMRRLVNTLLVVMIAGLLAVVIAMMLKLKQVSDHPVAGLKEGERIISVEATSERVSLIIEHAETGAQRVVILDGRTFRPIAEIGGE